MKVVCLGGGYASCCAARMLADAGHKVTIIEKEDLLGGMARSFYKDGLVYEFGPHILANHACDQSVIDFILKFIDVEQTQMETASYLQSQHLNYPPHIDDVPKLSESQQITRELNNLPKQIDETNFETYLISKVGKTLYELYFRGFTEKFWMVDPKTLSADWAKLRHLGESLYERKMFFNKTWCAYPKRDFNELFYNISKGIRVKFKTEVIKVDLEDGVVYLKGQDKLTADLIISSISVDQLLDYKYGKLAYRGYTIEPVIYEQESFHPKNPLTGNHYSMVYYPEDSVPHNRTTEYKWFNNKAYLPEYKNRTIITRETPNDKARFYPFMNTYNERLFDLYMKDVSKYPKLLTLGRMGLYKYTTLDTTTAQVMRFIDLSTIWQSMSHHKRYKSYQIIRGSWNN